MQDAKNDEKVEEKERERRSKNLIIHGAEEIGDDNNGIKEQDSGYVKEIFKKIGVDFEPLNIVRLGKANESRRRPIKIALKSNVEKNKVMANLNRLKGTEDEFGRISVTDDYTNNEREEIKAWTQKAQEKSAQDQERVYKVWGDPKNGLRLVSFTRK